MIEFISNYFEHSDERGSFQGLVNFGNWEEINIISSEAHSIRGNHYHKMTTQHQAPSNSFDEPKNMPSSSKHVSKYLLAQQFQIPENEKDVFVVHMSHFEPPLVILFELDFPSFFLLSFSLSLIIARIHIW